MERIEPEELQDQDCGHRELSTESPDWCFVGIARYRNVSGGQNVK